MFTDNVLNFLIALGVGAAAGFIVPKLFKQIQIKTWVAIVFGALCGVIGYYTGSAAFMSKSMAIPIVTAIIGVVIAALNYNQYYSPKHGRIAIVVRLFLGMFMLASGIMMLIAYNTVIAEKGGLPGPEGPVFDWLNAVIETGFLWQWIFIFKITFGILVLIPRTSLIGILGALPYYVNIIIYTVCLAQLWLALSIPAIIAVLYLIYAYWDYYKRIFER